MYAFSINLERKEYSRFYRNAKTRICKRKCLHITNERYKNAYFTDKNCICNLSFILPSDDYIISFLEKFYISYKKVERIVNRYVDITYVIFIVLLLFH